MQEHLPPFADEFLQVESGFIYGKQPEWVIIFVLKSFVLDGEPVETAIHLDSFRWNVTDPRLLANTIHDYPGEVEDRGSVYIRGAHHPVKVYQIAFGAAGGESIAVEADVAFRFDQEGTGFQNRSATLVATLQCREPRGIVSYRVVR